MISVDSLIFSRWLIPVEPKSTVYENYGLALHQGRIVAVLPAPALREQYQAAQTVELPHHVLIPGLINTHTHAAMSLMRGLADDLPLMEWLSEHIWPAEQQWVGTEFVEHGTELAIAEMLRSGVTCFNDMYFFPDIVKQTAMRLGMRVCLGLIVIDFPTAWANNVDEYLSKGLALHDEVKNHPLIKTMLAPHAPYTVSDAGLRRIQILAEELDIGVHIHLHETATEVQQSVEMLKLRPLARLHQLGLVSPRLLAVHMTQLIPEEIQLLAREGAHVIHCPESNLKLASGICPVQELLNQGVNVALGTDGAASNNDLDMLGEMHTAALIAKVQAQDARALNAEQCLRLATINAAKALGWDEHIGSLEVGKWADITAIDLNHTNTQPVYHPLSQIIYAAHRHQVSDVWVAGKQLLSQGELKHMDKVAIIAKAQIWQQKMQKFQ